MSEQRINDGGPAYPHDQNSGQWRQCMTLRQWYAGQALAGMLANKGYTNRAVDSVTESDDPKESVCTVMSGWAFAIADAMIAHEQKERDYE